MSGLGRRARRGDVRALLSLDDRMLADIGLRRAEVAAVVSGQLPLNQLTARGPFGAPDRQRLPSVPTVPAQPPAPAPSHAVA